MDRSCSDEEALRQIAYEVAVRYNASVRELQRLDEEFTRRVSFNPRDFIFTD